jgi:hypothetical protein
MSDIREQYSTMTLEILLNHLSSLQREPVVEDQKRNTVPWGITEPPHLVGHKYMGLFLWAGIRRLNAPRTVRQ